MSEIFWYLSSGLPSDPSRTGIKVIFPKKFLKGTLRVWLYYCNGTGIFCETCQLFSDLCLYNSHSYKCATKNLTQLHQYFSYELM